MSDTRIFCASFSAMCSLLQWRDNCDDVQPSVVFQHRFTVICSRLRYSVVFQQTCCEQHSGFVGHCGVGIFFIWCCLFCICWIEMTFLPWCKCLCMMNRVIRLELAGITAAVGFRLRITGMVYAIALCLWINAGFGGCPLDLRCRIA